MLQLSSLVSAISHIGKTVETQLKHLGVMSVHDLLFYFPSRYDDLSKIVPIKEARVGARVVLRGRVELLSAKRSKFRHKVVTHGVVADTTGAIRVVWFNQPWIAKMFKEGDELYLVGEVKDDGSGAYLSSPIYERVAKTHAATHVARIVPVYPSTEKLSQKQIRFLVQRVLSLARTVSDPLPREILSRYRLLALSQALDFVHFPPDERRLELARRRLKFDELLRLQLFAVSLKRELKKIPAPIVSFREHETKRFVEGLPFTLTEDQRKAAWEIIGDIGRARPMNRLLEGDVGSGKTVVVAITALNAVLGGCPSPGLRPPSPTRGEGTVEQFPSPRGRGEGEGRGQVAIMAPTEILARQHFKTFSKLFEPQGITVELRTGSEKKSKGIIDADVVIGTHALISARGGSASGGQESCVQFKNLVLAVIDEQHRFGVSQRQALKEKRQDGQMPHLLTLTATPIPRSLALVFYGDLDISILREMPKGRQAIETILVVDRPSPPPSPARGEGVLVQFPSPRGRGEGEGAMWSREHAYEFVRAQVAAGHQVFWTCSIIDPSDTLGVKAATEVFEHLKTEVFTDLKIGLLHGRMRPKEREKIMEEFTNREIDILVATPVIEVGIDVPNATVMVIEGSERFGLAQLHQFRGRVGRSEAKSYCLLMVDEGEMRARIQAFIECNDGFELAERDLALRGPGEVYGMAQSGFPEFKIASFADIDIAKEAKEAAEILLTQDPELTRYPELKKAVLEKEGKAHLE